MSGIHHAPTEGSFDVLSTSSGSVRVVHDGGRATMFLDAPGMNDDERSTHWISADADDVADLDAMC